MSTPARFPKMRVLFYMFLIALSFGFSYLISQCGPTCADHWTCHQGHCISALHECDDTGSCTPGYFCGPTNKCLPSYGCDTIAPCTGSSEMCVGGSCIVNGSECTQNDQCSPVPYCLMGYCWDTQNCTIHSDCGPYFFLGLLAIPKKCCYGQCFRPCLPTPLPPGFTAMDICLGSSECIDGVCVLPEVDNQNNDPFTCV